MPKEKYPIYKLSDVIRIAQAALEEHGDLPVYYISDYDWVMPLRSNGPKKQAGWDNEPKGKYFGLGN